MQEKVENQRGSGRAHEIFLYIYSLIYECVWNGLLATKIRFIQSLSNKNMSKNLLNELSCRDVKDGKLMKILFQPLGLKVKNKPKLEDNVKIETIVKIHEEVLKPNENNVHEDI